MVRSHPLVPNSRELIIKEKLVCTFSGGRTSARMAKLLQEENKYDIFYVFANTGLEHENTLKFIDRCSKEWGIDIIWLEAVVHHGKRKASTHKVVNYETATRGGDLFEEMVLKYGIPNGGYPHCTRELKTNPIRSWKRENNLLGAKQALGIRIDEIDRISTRTETDNLVYPLISEFPTTKEEVLKWWKTQPFDLEVDEHYGNCIPCWKKSANKQLTIASEHPEYFDPFIHIEETMGTCGYGGKERTFNSGKRFNKEVITVREIVELAKLGEFTKFNDYGIISGCGTGECQAFIDL